MIIEIASKINSYYFATSRSNKISESVKKFTDLSSDTNKQKSYLLGIWILSHEEALKLLGLSLESLKGIDELPF